MRLSGLGTAGGGRAHGEAGEPELQISRQVDKVKHVKLVVSKFSNLGRRQAVFSGLKYFWKTKQGV